MTSYERRKISIGIVLFGLIITSLTLIIMAASETAPAIDLSASTGLTTEQNDSGASSGKYLLFKGRATENCIDPAGYVKPLVGKCVGVPEGTNLTPYVAGQTSANADQVITLSTPGQVIDGKIIYGCINITASNVTIKNSYIECYRSRDIVNNNSGYDGVIAAGGQNTQILNNELVCKIRVAGVAPCDFSIEGANVVAKYNNIYGGVDAIGVKNNSEYSYNYMHDLTIVYEEWRNDHSHADFFQLYAAGNGGVTIKGNYLEGKTYSVGGVQGMLIQASSTNTPKPDVIITQNRLDGTFGSLRISCIGAAACAVSNNVIDDQYKSSNWVIQFSGAHSSSYSKCNKFEDGSFVQNSNMKDGVTDNTGC